MPIIGLVFSPDQTRLAAASAGGRLRVWDAASGKELINIRENGDVAVLSVAFSADSHLVAWGNSNGTLHFHDLRTGHAVLFLSAHDKGVSRLAFHPQGLRLASASEDGMVKLWDTRTGQEALSLRGYTQYVTSLAFSPDGHRLAAAAGDSVKIWDATPLETSRNDNVLEQGRRARRTPTLG